MNFTRLVFPGITMIAVTYGLARYSFGLLLPNISKSFIMSDTLSGIISSLFYLAFCFTIIYSTVITTNKGPRPMIMLAGGFAVSGMLMISASLNEWMLAAGVLLAGGSTGLVSPPFGSAIALWIKAPLQGKANTWINSGTSLGIVATGLGAILLPLHWRYTYLLYALIALIVLWWNYRIIPKADDSLKFQRGILSAKGVEGAKSIIIGAILMGISSACFWTFSRSFIESSGEFNSLVLSLFWVTIGLFGITSGLGGTVIERIGLQSSYTLFAVMMGGASFLLTWASESTPMILGAAALFGTSNLFICGLLIVWGIRVFESNASLGIGLPFIMLSFGQVIGSILAGSMIEWVGYAVTFAVFGAISIVGSFLRTA
ncbi:MFS transporter [Halobacillus sp. Cin3]|uniref:MFS transporter n=1 Tax=Halobacillus sp. Cin3 TaxID=2928441 RepID=UPI00248D5441|nr:MFS transporter [Halobacillus sp. Cin3]